MPSVTNQNKTTLTGVKAGREQINNIEQYTTPPMDNECTRASEGHTTINSKLSPI